MGTIKSGEQTRLLTRKRIGIFFANTYQHDVVVSGKANETKEKNEKVYFRPLLSFKNIFMPCTHVSLCCFFIRSAREITDAVKPADPFYNADPVQS